MDYGLRRAMKMRLHERGTNQRVQIGRSVRCYLLYDAVSGIG